MRYLILIVVLFSCMEERLTIIKECKKYCFSMTISDATPIQFWVNGEETFNESQPICGLNSVCFCQPFNCDDEIKIQGTDEPGKIYELVIKDVNGDELSRIAFDEVSSGIYQVEFTPNDLSICENVSLSIDVITLPGWTPQVSAADNNWHSVVYGNGLFVAVSITGTGNRVMTSPDGVVWTSRVSAADNNWRSVTYGSGLFVAVSNSGSDRVMTSPDGIVWTLRSSIDDTNGWFAVTYGNGLFVATSENGAAMYSSDGISWTLGSGVPGNSWRGVTYGNGLFVAVAQSGSGNRVMTSTDGAAWTAQSSAADNNWQGVVYGSGLFVAVANSGTGDRVMTSPDGITWTLRVSASDDGWRSVVIGRGFLVAVAQAGNSMYSVDGVTWILDSSPSSNFWTGLTFGDDKFVSVSISGTGDRVMTQEADSTSENSSDCIYLRNNHQCTKLIEYTNASDFDGIKYEISPQPTFYLRVPAQLLPEENPMTQEDLELSNGVIVTLRQTIQEKYIFKLGYITPYLHTKTQKILMHDTVIIDGVQWKRRDPYEAPRIEDYPLKKGEVLLTKYNSVLKNTI